MIVRVDPDSVVPPYEQLRSQVATMIAGGSLPPGQRLPTIRQLAADLGLAGGTVARAYRELERDGLILSRGRKGTFVAAEGRLPDGERDRQLEEAAGAFALQAFQLGADPRMALEKVRETLRELRPTGSQNPA
jgi:DNA-binding transcriptional regulator YhcF (GntR family)